ncbi:hypothetical protein KGF56_002408 [Candida oxycetoniae]|uniref:BTB domain-containing protein n=1 Tax=Candida oxycetoniae TaxID=497107 RepID=A0AAI9SXX4_9ASCO|nr:uncharacterized protein KGF56_002408 [Candida oxycetoniae]KAI3404778.2 hypothetical protein KGF56_002408 [Candida oxycetoniae]
MSQEFEEFDNESSNSMESSSIFTSLADRYATTRTTTTTTAAAAAAAATSTAATSSSSLLQPSSHKTSSSQSPKISDAFNKICMACRTGDYEVVDSLLSTPDLDVNQVDEYDYSPLILSSLCGHIKIVELLLKRGAVCDRDTFQGARCIYGALTDEIRDLLVSFDISKAVDMNQPFAGHIASLLATNTNKDILFKFSGNIPDYGESIALHRFLLAARSSYFKKKLLGDWKYLNVVTLSSNVTPEAFKVIVDYIYLRNDSIVIIDKSIRAKVLELATAYELFDLVSGITDISAVADDEKGQSKIKHEWAFKFVEKARKDLDLFLVRDIISEKFTSPMNLNQDIDLEDIDCQEFITEKRRGQFLESPSIPDIILSCVDSDTESVVYFPLNKSILARSEYFETMFKSEIFTLSMGGIPLYREGEGENTVAIINRENLDSVHLPVISLSSSTANEKVAAMVLSYLYHDNVSNIPLENVIELLIAADELFLERLKTMCAVRVSSQFGKFNYAELQQLESELNHDAFDLIRISWQTRCDKLEQHVTKMIAYNLQAICQETKEKKKLMMMINESAARIRERQATDTIELVDDIRYYLAKKYAISEESESFDPLYFGTIDRHAENINLYKNAVLKYDQDIAIIDTLLDSLNLEA